MIRVYANLPAAIGTIYAIAQNADGNIFNGSGFDDPPSPWSNAVIALTRAGERVHADLPVGAVTWDIRRQAGGSPASTDRAVWHERLISRSDLVTVDGDEVSGLWYLNQRIQDNDAQGLAFMGFTYNGTSSLNVNVTKVNGVADAANGIEQVASAYLLNGRINANVTAIAGVVNAATGLETLSSQYFSNGRLLADGRDGTALATNSDIGTVLGALSSFATPIAFISDRIALSLPNAAPGDQAGLSRVQDVNVDMPAPLVSPVLVASPMVSQLESAGRAVRVGPVRPVDYQVFQHTAAALVINPVDAAGEPIDLSGSELRFLVHDSNGVVKFQLGADDGVVFTDGTVTVPIAAANLATKADWQWKLRDLTGEMLLGYGRFEILLAPLSAPTP